MSVIAVSILSALATLISHGTASERAIRAAISMILIYTVSRPVIAFVSEADPSDFYYETGEGEEISDPEYLKVAEEAFVRGVRLAVCEKFDLNDEDVHVLVSGFDFEKMRAGKIKIILYGRAALADARNIEAYVSEGGLGHCEVDIGIA